MLRCPDPAAGVFRVTFEFLNGDGSVDPAERRIRIGLHGNAYRCAEGGEIHLGIDPPPPQFPGDQRHWDLVEEAPHVSQSQPYEGELSPHEYTWLKSLPGKEYSAHWHFGVAPAKAPMEVK